MVRKGTLRAGTKENTFKNKLTITLYGEKYDSAMPGMGNKLIGIVNGKLSLHGDPR
jgi:hypothetical protein